MPNSDQPYSTGNWTVKAGSEAEFVKQWDAFTKWSAENADGADSFVLIQSTENPRQFLSFGSWRDMPSMQAWRNRPEFAELFGKCRALCDEMSGDNYTLRAINTSAAVVA